MAKIALIEDEPLFRRFMIRFLEQEGHDVIDFPDAAPALEQCPFEEMDLILTDLEMPTRGEELIQAVRSKGIQTPIVVISGHLAGRFKQYEVPGAQAVLAKPFDSTRCSN